MSHQKRLMRILTTRETISFWIVVLQTSPKRNYQISNVEVATLLFTQSFWAVLICFYAAETKYNETLVAAHCYTDNVWCDVVLDCGNARDVPQIDLSSGHRRGCSVASTSAMLLGSSDALVCYLSPPSIMSNKKRLMHILTAQSSWVVQMRLFSIYRRQV